MAKQINPGAENFSIDDFIGGRSPSKENDRVEEIYKTVREEITQPTAPSKPDDDTVADKSMRKTVSSKQRKASLEEYQTTFLKIPKITDRKTVFISNSVREQIVDIVRKLGGEKTSVSGFIENLVCHHLETYEEDIESWKKL